MTEGKKRGWLDWYFKSNLLMRILIGLILGAIVGLIVGPKITVIKSFGDLLIRLLVMTVVPLTFFSFIAGTAGMSPAKLGRVGIKVLVYYLITTAFAVIIGLFLGNVFHVGRGLSLVGAGGGVTRTAQAPSIVDTLLNIVPKNLVGSLAAGDILPIIFFAVLFGIGVSFLRESKDERMKHAGQIIYDFSNGGFHIMIKLAEWILQYVPTGVFALLAVVLGTQGAKVIGPLGVF